ncbi:MAG: relaxase domain-containing protein, partial [Actinomycetota bacterium]|nr:relaxase domain-containing protein [Actinomycetota bacterium]
MIVSVTALGSRNGDAASAAARVVEYLDGRAPCAPGRSTEWWDDNELADKAPCHHGLGFPADGALGYYADSVEGPGQWVGRGLAGFSPAGEVARSELQAMLLGRHPGTREQLLDGRGSATRAAHLGRHGPEARKSGPDDELVTIAEAAALLNLSPQYLRKLAGATAKSRSELGNVAEPDTALPLDGPYLDATRDARSGHWRVTRAEVARFAAARKAPSAVIGYDLTFSVPKSVSILWAQAEPGLQETIVAAVDAAVAAGVSYLEEHAAYIRTGCGLQKATGLLAASYLHATSRALDPQLHAHVVVANMAQGRGGEIRTVDGRPLFAHAKTAGYLAAAELRHQLARRLGVAWDPAERGLADVAGVPREAIVAMSKRSQELDQVVGDLEKFLTAGNGLRARGRQVAAYITRAAKDEHGVDPAALRPWWSAQLAGVGFGPKAAQRCLERQAAPALVTEEDRAELVTHLGSHNGVTATAATFTRRDVLQHVAEWAGDRLPAATIANLVDAWLASEVVVRLDHDRREARRCDVVRLANGQSLNAVGTEALFTTEAMLEVEHAMFATYARGRHAGAGVVPTATLDAVLSSRPELGEDQLDMVRSICTSGHRIQCVLGPAGSGKTFALAAAARAWEDAGYLPIGAVVQGTATEVLRDATAMACSTVASLLTRLDLDVPNTLSERHVVVVDESSTLSNRDLARLASYVERAGASLRLIGDPAQHSAVAAGGGWRALLERYPEDKAELVVRRRQAGEEMTQVRLASLDYAAGHISAAIERLRRDERVVEADTPDELLDALVADWYLDRLRRAADPSQRASSMIADHHVERRELNRRARALLAAQGQLAGPVVEVADQCFQAGDEVIDVAQQRELFPDGGTPRDRVCTGERGRVVEVRPGPQAVVVVDFERRGRVEVGEHFLARRVRPGVTGVIAHSYALTSHMAQGETYQAGRHLSTDVSSREGVYVGLTRGKGDAALYMVRRRDLLPPLDGHAGLPRLEDDTETVKAVARSLEAQRSERLAEELDPLALEVARLQRSHTLAELAVLAGTDDDRLAGAA